jgi:DNA polymerase III subunit delta'
MPDKAWPVIGQTRAVSLLQHGLETGRLSHAYLFIGPAHVGKMTLALTLAQALNCEGEAKPCGQCGPCKKILAGNHPDIQVISLMQDEDLENVEKKNITTEQIGYMIHVSSLPPFEGKHRVFIIDGAELMSNEAANHFLKNLEEPEPGVTYLLLTRNDRLLLPTIISRCQKLELQPMSVDDETAALIKTLKLPPERARLLAGLSHGCPGWAIAAAGDDALMEYRNDALDLIMKMISAGYEDRFDYAAKLAAGFSKERGQVYDMLERWQDLWRDMMLARIGSPDMMTNIDRKDAIIKIAANYRLARIKDGIRSIGAAAQQLRQNVNARLALEVLMLDIPREEVLVPTR